MWRILNDADHSGTVADGAPSLSLGSSLIGRLATMSLEGVKAHTQGNGEFALCQRISKLALISTNKKLLLHEFSQITLSFDVPEKRPDGLA